MNYCLIAYSPNDISAQNYQNWLMYIKVIACRASVVFLVQCIELLIVIYHI